MSNGNKIELFGFKELDDFFEKMERKDQRKVILDAYRIGAKPLIKEARSNLKQKTESNTRRLYKSLGFVALRAKRQSVFASAKVGARRFGRYQGFHGHLVDKGTGNRSTAKGKSRGAMPATSFFSDAVEKKQDEVLKQAGNSMIVSLDKLIQKHLKKIKS